MNDARRTYAVATAVQQALSATDRELLLKRAIQNNPRLRGAEVADILDMAYQADGFLGRTESFWTAHPELLEVGSDSTITIAYALIAAAYLNRDDDWVINLAAQVQL